MGGQSQPHVLIAMDSMMRGGIEKSLISLLSVLHEDEIKCDVLLNKKKGAFLKYIPEWVRIKSIQYDDTLLLENRIGRTGVLKYLFMNFHFIQFLRVLNVYRYEKRLGYDEEIINRARRFQDGILNENEFLDPTYDMAVAYANFEQMILVAEKVKARKKIAFFHSDISDVATNIHAYDEVLSHFDSFYCVSKDLTSALKKEFPEFSDHIYYYPHIFSRKNIEYFASLDEAKWPMKKGLKLLTVARFERDKGVDLIPDIAKELREKGIAFNWLVIGEGSLFNEFVKKVNEYGLESHVTCCGAMDNPYPYFKSCDIYIQPSRNEGYCLTLAEARTFNCPIVSTRFYGSIEQLDNGRLGHLTDCDVNSLSTAIYELCINDRLRQKYTLDLSKEFVDSTEGAKLFMQEIKI